MSDGSTDRRSESDEPKSRRITEKTPPENVQKLLSECAVVAFNMGRSAGFWRIRSPDLSEAVQKLSDLSQGLCALMNKAQEKKDYEMLHDLAKLGKILVEPMFSNQSDFTKGQK